MITADFHLHTVHSEDSETPMEIQVEAGIKKGLKIMCITEHMDRDFMGYDENNRPFEVDTDTYYNDYVRVRELYKDKMDLRFGVEYGFQKHLTSHCKEYVSTYPFDFVIGSLHLLDGIDVYYPEIYMKNEEKDVYRRYFENVLYSVNNFDDYDVFGHIDYVVRYGPTKNQNYFYADYEEVFEEILKRIIDKGKGIEINTGGFRKLGDSPNPSIDILRRYRELGGEIITVGSDAHIPEDVAADFDRAEMILTELGYRFYSVFKNRKVEFVPFN